MMKTISIVNNKGGVGKSSSVQNVGAYLAQQGLKVLLIDLDAQGNLATSYKIEKYDLAKDSGDWILEEATFEEVALVAENLTIIPATRKLMDAERILQGRNMYHRYLTKRLKAVEGYDYCIIDCPPALGAMTVNALNASSFFFVPLQTEYLSYEGIRELLLFVEEIQEEHPVTLGGVFATRYNPNRKVKSYNELVQAVKADLGEKFMDGFNIRENVAVSEAQFNGVDVFTHDPNCNASHDYAKLSMEILKRIN